MPIRGASRRFRVKRFAAVRTTLLIVTVLALCFMLPGWRDASPPYSVLEDRRELEEHIKRGFATPLNKFVDALVADPKHVFDWEQLLDFSSVPQSLSGLDPVLYPYLSGHHRQIPIQRPTTECEQALIGLLYSLNNMPAPRKLLLLRANGDRQLVKGIAGITSLKTHRQFGLGAGDFDDADPLPVAVPEYGSNISVDLSAELFAWPMVPRHLVVALQDDEHWHARSLSLAAELVAVDEQKHFYEAQLLNHLGASYDWRFFRGTIKFAEHTRVVRRIAQAWARFASAESIIAWWAHGSALGWYWNGLTMPWDPDNDVQVPVSELNRLARDYNGTMVVVDEHAYLIDINPWFVERRRAAGHNLVDGRFIDVETGMFVDISGLAAVDEPHNTVVSCRYPHNFDLKDILPLRRTAYEGASGYVPNPAGFDKHFRKEYGKKWALHKFNKWIFNPEEHTWTTSQPCPAYMRSMHIGSPTMCPPFEAIEPCSTSDRLKFACNQYFSDYYDEAKTHIANHEREITVWPLDVPFGELSEMQRSEMRLLLS